jgi:hypothetical protein
MGEEFNWGLNRTGLELTLSMGSSYIGNQGKESCSAKIQIELASCIQPEGLTYSIYFMGLAFRCYAYSPESSFCHSW